MATRFFSLRFVDIFFSVLLFVVVVFFCTLVIVPLLGMFLRVGRLQDFLYRRPRTLQSSNSRLVALDLLFQTFSCRFQKPTVFLACCTFAL